ncbi:MAG: serine/threonine protein kinase, partial [Deltaproteobacteria bacterium]|nr:serine/threonine protein kinase [Deltaproteobacteria bacterium]
MGESRGRTIATTGGAHSATAAASTEVAPDSPGSGGERSGPQREPKQIGRYQLVRRLGEGGMGVVWEAIDPELGRGVAVKVMRESRAGSARLAERMRREAQALARLSHPNVVSVFDVGVDAGELYIVMQLIAGHTLDQAVRDRPLPQILALFAGAGRGLAAAHKAGIVHRDFKPTNVLVDEDGVAKVTDFGLARRSDDSSDAGASTPGDENDASLTRGDLVGTPAYMAPEQFLRGPVTPATDQFAFCLALWEAVTGERAYPGRDAKSIEEAVLADERRPLPSNVPQQVRAVLTRGLARDPAARFVSMTELVEQLAPKRRRLWLVAAAGALLLAAAAVAVAAALPGADPCAEVDRGAEAVWSPAARAAVSTALGPQAPSVVGALDQRTAFWRATRVEACRTNQSHADQAVLAERYRCLDRSLADEREAIRVLSAAPDPKTTALARDIAEAGVAPQRCTLEAAMHARTAKVAAPVAGALYDEIARGHAALKAGRAVDVITADPSLTPRVVATGDDGVIADYLELVGESYAAAGDLVHARATLRSAAEAAIRSGQDELAARSWAQLAKYSAEVGELKVA